MKAVRVAVFLNPANGPRNTNLQLVQEAARVIGLQIHILNASTSGEIDAAFASLARERPDALFVVPDQFSVRGPSRRDRRVGRPVPRQRQPRWRGNHLRYNAARGMRPIPGRGASIQPDFTGTSDA